MAYIHLFNLHPHSNFCDGSSAPEEYVEQAIKSGFFTLGFSSHAPVPFKNHYAIKDESKLLEYAGEIRRLKTKYKSKINIFLSLEIDYIPGITQSFEYFKKLIRPDYIIGGVHLVRNPEVEALWFIDGPKHESYDFGLINIFNNDIRLGVTSYFGQIQEMVKNEKPDIVAHLDKIKMHNKNRFFTEDEKWYEDMLDATIGEIAQAGCIVEVNTRGIYKGRTEELFPGVKALEKIRKRDIPITLNSDAHKPEELTAYFGEAIKILKNIGFKYLMNYTNDGWEKIKI